MSNARSCSKPKWRLPANYSSGGTGIFQAASININLGAGTASGGTQDVMSVIEEAMKQGLEDACAGPICDPGCVAQMIEAGLIGVEPPFVRPQREEEHPGQLP